MLLDYDPTVNLRHWPMPMARFGTNPYGGNLYRIVFAPSRRHLVRGPGAQGEKTLAWLHKYPAEADRRSWVMEKWISTVAYTGTTAAEWNAAAPNFVVAEGEYEMCHEFFGADPGHSNIEKLIYWIGMGHVRRPVENQIAIRDAAVKQEKEDRGNRIEKLKELMPAFADAPVSGYGGGSGTKTKTFKLDSRAIGINGPMQGMLTPGQTTGKNKRRFHLGTPQRKLVHAS